MKTFFLLLLLLAGGFAFWKYNDQFAAPSPHKSGTITHIVTKGDTLYSLAKKHNTTVEAIMQSNQLESKVLHTGDVLHIVAGPESTPTPRKPTSEQSHAAEKPSIAAPQPPKTKTPPVIANKKQLPKSTVMVGNSIAIDINAQNQVYLKTRDGKFVHTGSIIYGSDADANGNEVKTITYRDLKGRETTLPGSADPEMVILKSLEKR